MGLRLGETAKALPGLFVMSSKVRPWLELNQRQSFLLANVKHGFFRDDSVHALLPSEGHRAFLQDFVLIGLGSGLHGDHHFGLGAGHQIHGTPHSLSLLPGDHPVSQVSVFGNLHGS